MSPTATQTRVEHVLSNVSSPAKPRVTHPTSPFKEIMKDFYLATNSRGRAFAVAVTRSPKDEKEIAKVELIYRNPEKHEVVSTLYSGLTADKKYFMFNEVFRDFHEKIPFVGERHKLESLVDNEIKSNWQLLRYLPFDVQRFIQPYGYLDRPESR